MDTLVAFDLESTGVDPYTDRAVELCMVEYGPDSPEGDVFQSLINPGIPIPQETTEIHGITDADVADAPTFDDVADEVQHRAGRGILVGLNSRRFDTILLHQELRRAGRDGLPQNRAQQIIVPEIDLYRIWVESEPRSLADAIARFAPDFEHDPHRAGSDTAALGPVLVGMCRDFGLDHEDTDALQKISVPENAVDRDGKFVKNDAGVVVFNIGDQKGDPATSDPGFLRWMPKKDFSPETKAIARILIARAEGTIV